MVIKRTNLICLIGMVFTNLLRSLFYSMWNGGFYLRACIVLLLFSFFFGMCVPPIVGGQEKEQGKTTLATEVGASAWQLHAESLGNSQTSRRVLVHFVRKQLKYRPIRLLRVHVHYWRSTLSLHTFFFRLWRYNHLAHHFNFSVCAAT